MRVAAVAGNGVHGLDLLRPHLEEQLVRAPDDLVLVHARPEHPVDLLVHRVDEARRLVEECDLVRRLDLARLEHDTRAVGDVDARALQRLEREHVGHVDSEWLAGKALLSQLVRDPRAEAIRDPGLDGHRSAHRRDACAEVLGWHPRGEELMVAGRRSEVPQDRLAAARQQREAGVLVPRPLPDVRARCSDRKGAARRGPKPRAPTSPVRDVRGEVAGSRSAAPSPPPASRRASRRACSASSPQHLLVRRAP